MPVPWKGPGAKPPSPPPPLNPPPSAPGEGGGRRPPPPILVGGASAGTVRPGGEDGECGGVRSPGPRYVPPCPIDRGDRNSRVEPSPTKNSASLEGRNPRTDPPSTRNPSGGQTGKG